MTLQMDDRIESPAATEVPSICRVVMKIWTQVLATDSTVGPDDNFFELGGDSIAALSVVFRFHQLFGIEVSPVIVFDAPTPRLLGDWLDGQGIGPQAPATPP
jgi:acyl carrier protein